MKHKHRKSIPALLTAALILSGLTACGNEDTTGSGTAESASAASTGGAVSSEGNSGSTSEAADSEERQSVSVMSLTFSGNPVDGENADVQALQEHTNFDIEWTWILDADYSNKINTLIAGKTLPEITLLKSIDAAAVQNCRSGAFWDLTDYIGDYEYLSQMNEVVINNTSIDGRIYGIPRSRTLMRNGIVYRQDWLDNLDLEPATNLEEFREILRAFTYDDPDGNGVNDTYGLVSTSSSTGFDTIAMWFGAPNGWGEDENGDLQPAFMTEEYYESMIWLKELYDDGILNEDFPILENSGVKNAFQAQQTGIYISNCDEANTFYKYFQEQNIDASLTVTAQFETPAGKVVAPTDGFSGILCISTSAVKTEEDLRRCLTFLDRCNDEFSQNLFTYGLEGVDWTLNEDGTINRAASTIESLEDHDGFNQIMTNVVDLTYTQVPATDVAAQVLAAQEENMAYILPNPAKALLIASETYNSSGSQLDQMISDARIQFIVGELDESGWNDVIESWKQQGGSAVIEEVNAIWHSSK